MLLYLIVVLVLLGLIIGISFLIVQRRVPPYQPPPVEKKDGLNDLGYLKETVKKKEEPQNDEQTEQQTENEDTGAEQEEETQEKQKQQKNTHLLSLHNHHSL